MNMYKKNFHIFIKHRLIVAAIIIYTVFNIAEIIITYAEIVGQGYMVLEYTRRILMLSPQFFVLYLITAYEFFSEPNRSGLEESIAVTGSGYSNRQRKSMFMVIFTVLFINYAAFSIFDIIITKIDLSMQNIQDIENQGIIHINNCLFLNLFLISSIAIFLGALIARIQKRITAYAIIMAVVFLASYLLNEVATLILILTDYAVNIFEILDLLNIMPQGLTFSVNSAFGFPLLPNRISLIIFWNAALLLLLTAIYSKKYKPMKIMTCLTVCIAALVVHSLPASTIDMSLNSKGSAMADQHYYAMAEYRMKEEPAKFSVKRYTIKLDTRRLLKAEVAMVVDKPLAEYKFTLFHNYKISEAFDQDGQPLQYKQYKDELTVYAPDKDITEITLKYEGASEGFYSNMQGINLPGTFPYYPMPGRCSITEDGQHFNDNFLKQEAEFDLYIKGSKEIHTNLEKKADGHYVGKSKGLSIVSGIYTEYNRDGICVVYPYLIGWGQDDLEKIVKAVKKAGYDKCKVFITPNMNRDIDAIGEDQLITKGYLESVDDLR